MTTFSEFKSKLLDLPPNSFAPSGIAYIASNGSDTTGDGSPAKPFQTVAKALQNEFVYFHFLTPSFGGEVHLTADLECWIDGLVGGGFNLYPEGHNVIIHGSGVDRAGINNLESTSGGSITLEGVRVAGYLVGINEATGGNGSTINVTRSLVMGETYLYGSNGEAGNAGSPSVFVVAPPDSVDGESDYAFTLNDQPGSYIQSGAGSARWSDVNGFINAGYGTYTSTANTDQANFATESGVNLISATPGTNIVNGTNGGNAGTLNIVDSELLGPIHIAAGIGGLNASNGDTGSISALGSKFRLPSDDYNGTPINGNLLTSDGVNFNFFAAY
jgi:hypothetical protein